MLPDVNREAAPPILSNTVKEEKKSTKLFLKNLENFPFFVFTCQNRPGFGAWIFI